MKQKISFFYKQPNQLNDILRKLHIIIDFLKTTGCPKNFKIVNYAIDTLKMNIKDDLSLSKHVMFFLY